MVDSKALKQKRGSCIVYKFFHDCPMGGEYSCDHVRSMEVVAANTPDDVVRYMNLKTLGTT
jgi:hypothetical protein